MVADGLELELDSITVDSEVEVSAQALKILPVRSPAAPSLASDGSGRGWSKAKNASCMRRCGACMMK